MGGSALKKLTLATTAALLLGGAAWALAASPLPGTSECEFLSYHLPIGRHSLTNGSKLYAENCASCHGSDGNKLDTVKLGDPQTWKHGSKPHDVYRTLVFGLPKAEPSPVATASAEAAVGGGNEASVEAAVAGSDGASSGNAEVAAGTQTSGASVADEAPEVKAKTQSDKGQAQSGGVAETAKSGTAVPKMVHKFARFNKGGNMTPNDVWNTTAYVLSLSCPLEVVKMPSGLQYVTLRHGEGATAVVGNMVTAHYTGWLTNGTIFDSSYPRHKAFSFKLGSGQVIRVWEEAVQGMKVGEIRQIILPPELGYGDRAAGAIPPGSVLCFQIELVSL